MASFSPEEAAAIIAESRELLERRHDEMFAREPEHELPPLEEILRQPCESRNERARRELAERDARWAAQRRLRTLTDADALATGEAELEERLAGMRAEQREVALSLVEDALATFGEEICALFERQLAALEVELKNLRERQRAFDAAEILDLPNVLEARRVQ